MAPIRSAHPKDTQVLIGLIDDAYQGYRDEGVRLPDVSAGLAESIAAGQVWVAESQQGLCGVVILSRTPPSAHLINVAVLPSEIGLGVGGRLIRFAVALAGDSGCREITLTTHPDLVDNLALYEYLGWHITKMDSQRVEMSRPCGTAD